MVSRKSIGDHLVMKESLGDPLLSKKILGDNYSEFKDTSFSVKHFTAVLSATIWLDQYRV